MSNTNKIFLIFSKLRLPKASEATLCQVTNRLNHFIVNNLYLCNSKPSQERCFHATFSRTQNLSGIITTKRFIIVTFLNLKNCFFCGVIHCCHGVNSSSDEREREKERERKVCGKVRERDRVANFQLLINFAIVCKFVNYCFSLLTTSYRKSLERSETPETNFFELCGRKFSPKLKKFGVFFLFREIETIKNAF